MIRSLLLSVLLFCLVKVALAQLPDIVRMEYFFDTDPGTGNGVQVSVPPGSVVNVYFNADLTGLSTGYHKLYVRSMDANGVWSVPLIKDIYKSGEPSTGQPLPDITAMEYYFDTDPGFGNGTGIPMTSDSIADVNFNADVSPLVAGYHKLFVRARDENGQWSLVYKQDIYKSGEPSTGQPLPDITAMEYYFDTDPGFGNGTGIPLTSDSLVDVDFNADVAPLDAGYHKLFVRARDENGQWSLVYKQDIYKSGEPATGQPLPDITAMEYYFDTDPGFGNGTGIPVTSDSIADVNFNADVTPLVPGYHKLFVRARDVNGQWSLVYKQDIYKSGEPSTGQPLPDLTAMEYYIDTDPGHGNGISVPVTSDSVIDFILAPDITGLSIGNHYLYSRVKDENGKWSLSHVTPFYLMDLKTFLEGPYDVLAGLMGTVLNNGNYIPLSQPFGTNPSADWYYTGPENVPAIPNSNVVDWVLVQVRDASAPASATSATIKETKAVFLLNDGSIVGPDGITPVAFTAGISNNLYVVIYHRNHLGMMSSVGVPLSGPSSFTYDFTSGSGQAYGGAQAHKEIAPGIWGMVAADGNGDSQVNNTDKNDIWATQAGTNGYIQGDFSMDGQVNNTDKNELWKPNTGLGGQVPN